ncbi:MAG TPA: PASTA domain-containing protein [Marinilabiliaceae bacterium]|nr:PASTA domain-containing protein [Marinilabiliaceae bacterium]
MANWRVLIDKTIWKHVAIIFSSIVVLLIITFALMQVYTLHGQGKPVPDFTGLTEIQLQHLIKSNDLRYNIIDSVHLDNVPKGVVVEQVPKPGEKVKKNRRLFFTINAWTKEQVIIPRVIDLSLRDAKVLVESFGLTVGELIYIPSEFTNLVLGQHLNGKPVEPGVMVPRGTRIDLIVGRGLSNETTAVPHLIEMRLPEARRVTQSVYLNIGSTIYDQNIVTSTDSLKAFIWKQNPPSKKGFTRRLGASIDVWLTNDSSLIEPLTIKDHIEDIIKSEPTETQGPSIEDELF